MPVIETLLFDTPGPKNTAAALHAALSRARDLEITQFVVASSSGATALAAAEVLGPRGKVIGVHLSAGHWEKYGAPDPELVTQARQEGVTFLTGTHGLMGATDAALKELGGLPGSVIIAHTYYTFSQGTKVAVEDVLMAADAGLLDMEQEVISLAGSGHGCDTALVIKPAYSGQCFDLRVREIICKPR